VDVVRIPIVLIPQHNGRIVIVIAYFSEITQNTTLYQLTVMVVGGMARDEKDQRRTADKGSGLIIRH
jgi:hypothetical protein